MLDDFLLFSFSFFSPLPTNHAPPPIDNCSFSVRFFLDSCPRERHLTEQCVEDISKEDWAGWWKRKLPRIEAWAHGPVMRPTLHSLGRATEGGKGALSLKHLGAEKRKGGPAWAHERGSSRQVNLRPTRLFQPLPLRHSRKRKNRHRYASGCEPSRRAPPFFFSSSACFSFLSFFFFKFHEGQIRYGKYVSRVVASYRVRERKYISVFMRGKREEFRMGYVRRNSWEFVQRVRIVGIKFKIVSSERLEVIEFQKIWRNIYIYSNISGRGFKYAKLNHVVS